MISTELARRDPDIQDDIVPGSEFVGSAAFKYCPNCRKYRPKEEFVTTGARPVCRRCYEALIGVNHEKKVREWLRHIVNVFIDQELGEMKDTASISSMTWAKAFYSQFQGPSQCGATIGA